MFCQQEGSELDLQLGSPKLNIYDVIEVPEKAIFWSVTVYPVNVNLSAQIELMHCKMINYYNGIELLY
jgi:hypothetical protein